MITETIYLSNIKKEKCVTVSKTIFNHKADTIASTKRNLKNKTEKPLKINRIYKNNLLRVEITEFKIINYLFDGKGILTKKEGERKKDNQKNSETYKIKNENGGLSSIFCPAKNRPKTYYSNGFLKSYTTGTRN